MQSRNNIPSSIAPERRGPSTLKRAMVSALAAMFSALAPSVASATSPHDDSASHDDAPSDAHADKPKGHGATAKVDVDVDVKAPKGSVRGSSKKPEPSGAPSAHKVDKLHKSDAPSATVKAGSEKTQTAPATKQETSVKTSKNPALSVKTQAGPAKMQAASVKTEATPAKKLTASTKVELADGKRHVPARGSLSVAAKSPTVSKKSKTPDGKAVTADLKTPKGDGRIARAEVEVAKPKSKVEDVHLASKADADGKKKSARREHASTTSKILHPKTTAARAPSGSTRLPPTGSTPKGPDAKAKAKARAAAAKKPCYAGRVHADRGGLESESFSLVDCNGKPLASAQEKLGVLVRPWGVTRPTQLSATKIPKPDAKGEIAPGVRLVDPGVLTRLEAITKHFPGKGLSFVSGYRPQSKGSEHATGRAVDVRVVGVSNEELVAFCKTLKDTGCGYYPNSSFVHVDVRNPKTGSASWIDASGPGEAPRYVTRWPQPKGAAPDERDAAAAPEQDEAHDDVTTDDIPHRGLGEYRDRPVD